MRIYTIGHSTRTADDFVSLLRESGIVRLVDVRQYPSSRRLPHFNREALRARLEDDQIQYEWLQSLGGRRKARGAPSPNTGLRNPSFRNYADYMLTAAFREAVGILVSRASEQPTAIMCAEAVYWRCHRRLISDWLTAHGGEVRHIMGPGQVQPHVMTAGAVLRGDNVVYPDADQPQETLFGPAES